MPDRTSSAPHPSDITAREIHERETGCSLRNLCAGCRLGIARTNQILASVPLRGQESPADPTAAHQEELELPDRLDDEQLAAPDYATPTKIECGCTWAVSAAKDRDRLREVLGQIASALSIEPTVESGELPHIVAERLSVHTAELERRELFQREVNIRLGEAIRARDAAEIKSEESRRRINAAEAELNTVRSALESRVLLDVLNDDEVQAKIQIRLGVALSKVFGAFGIDLDSLPVTTEPDGWIVGSVDADGDVDLDWGEMIYRNRADAEAELAHDRREWADGEFRLYEVQEARK